MKLRFSAQKVEESLNIKFREHPSSGGSFVPSGHADGWTDGQTDLMKLIVAFRNSANAPKIAKIFGMPVTVRHKLQEKLNRSDKISHFQFCTTTTSLLLMREFPRLK
jgi:hypothetical protein